MCDIDDNVTSVTALQSHRLFAELQYYECKVLLPNLFVCQSTMAMENFVT
jgi:hypothetical protein